MKRFWQQATVHEDQGTFSVQLDGKPMRPFLKLTSRRLAEAIAAEWQTAGPDVQPHHLPLTGIAGTMQMRIAPDAAATIAALARYGAHDLLCYWAEQPDTLVARQAARWQPWLDWGARTHGAELQVARGIVAIDQPAAALAALRDAVAGLPPPELAALGVLVPATGSLVLGLAVTSGALAPREAYEIALLDELFEVEQWGDDPEAAHRRRSLLADIETAHRFVALHREDQNAVQDVGKPD